MAKVVAVAVVVLGVVVLTLARGDQSENNNNNNKNNGGGGGGDRRGLISGDGGGGGGFGAHGDGGAFAGDALLSAAPAPAPALEAEILGGLLAVGASCGYAAYKVGLQMTAAPTRSRDENEDESGS